jgi:hypothetical protein
MLISALLVAGVGFLQISPVQPPEMDLSTTPSNAELNAMMEVLRKDKAKIVNQLYAVLILYLFSLTLVLSALICRLHVVYAAFNPSRKGKAQILFLISCSRKLRLITSDKIFKIYK